MQVQNKQRDKSYDFIRAFAMILIVVWHFWTTSNDVGILLPINPLFESAFAGGGTILMKVELE